MGCRMTARHGAMPRWGRAPAGQIIAAAYRAPRIEQPFRGVAERKTRGLQVPVAIGRVGSNPAAPTKCMKKRIKASGVGCDAAACCFGRGR